MGFSKLRNQVKSAVTSLKDDDKKKKRDAIEAQEKGRLKKARRGYGPAETLHKWASGPTGWDKDWDE